MTFRTQLRQFAQLEDAMGVGRLEAGTINGEELRKKGVPEDPILSRHDVVDLHKGGIRSVHAVQEGFPRGQDGAHDFLIACPDNEPPRFISEGLKRREPSDGEGFGHEGRK